MLENRPRGGGHIQRVCELKIIILVLLKLHFIELSDELFQRELDFILDQRL